MSGEGMGTVPHSSPSQCTGGVQGSCHLSSPVEKATGLVPESAFAPEQNAKPRIRQDMVVGIECHPKPRTLLQGCGCVCLVRPGSVNPGREHGVQESKAQEAPPLPQLFFPDATERTPKALLRKHSEVRFAPS